MKQLLLTWNFIICLSTISAAQTFTDSSSQLITDSISLRDTVKKTSSNELEINRSKDSISKKTLNISAWTLLPYPDSSTNFVIWQIQQHHPYFGFKAPVTKPFEYVESKREWKGKDLLFYLIVFLFILFALLKNTFPKYFDDLFRVFFRTTLKQRQISEQLEQTPIPSLLLNGFFIITGGLYVTFMFEHFGLGNNYNFWILFIYSSIGLFVIYLFKFVGLKLSGWLFGVEEAAKSYIFIVFVINKMIGILLLPFLVMLSFTSGIIYSAGLTISWCLIGVLFAYRIILTFAAVRNEVKVNPFHFFLYLCAFEIAPLLLIYKALLVFLRITA